MDKLDPEKDTGPIEYKLILNNDTVDKVDKLTSQLRYRLQEGNGICTYILGIKDNGTFVGLTDQEHTTSYNILKGICTRYRYDIDLQDKRYIEDIQRDKVLDRYVYFYTIKGHISIDPIDTSTPMISQGYNIRIGIGGSVDSGKSTTTAILVSGDLDNGRGQARSTIFNYNHEHQTGRTSSISHNILGYDKDGKPVYSRAKNKKDSWRYIVENSSKVVTLLDLAGHDTYLKTTIYGMTSSLIDYCCIVIGANMGIQPMTKEHLLLCLSLRIPFFIVVTKLDLCDNRQSVLDTTLTSIHKLLTLPGVKKVPLICDSTNIVQASKDIGNIVPIICISNTTGQGHPILRTFIYHLQPLHDYEGYTSQPPRLSIDSVFNVPGIGVVVGGILLSGTISIDDRLIVGPNKNGLYLDTSIKSIHSKRVPISKAYPGTYVCVALRKIDRNSIRKGMMLLSSKADRTPIHEFESEIYIHRNHSTTIKPRFEPMVTLSNIRAVVIVVDIYNEDKLIRGGDRCKVRMRFKHSPYHIVEGLKLVLSEGKLRGYGSVSRIIR